MAHEPPHYSTLAFAKRAAENRLGPILSLNKPNISTHLASSGSVTVPENSVEARESLPARGNAARYVAYAVLAVAVIAFIIGFLATPGFSQALGVNDVTTTVTQTTTVVTTVSVETTPSATVSVETTPSATVSVETTPSATVSIETTPATTLTISVILTDSTGEIVDTTITTVVALPATVETTVGAPVTVETTVGVPATVETTVGAAATVQVTVSQPVTLSTEITITPDTTTTTEAASTTTVTPTETVSTVTVTPTETVSTTTVTPTTTVSTTTVTPTTTITSVTLNVNLYLATWKTPSVLVEVCTSADCSNVIDSTSVTLNPSTRTSTISFSNGLSVGGTYYVRIVGIGVGIATQTAKVTFGPSPQNVLFTVY